MLLLVCSMGVIFFTSVDIVVMLRLARGQPTWEMALSYDVAAIQWIMSCH